jgi:hypothetical protein
VFQGLSITACDSLTVRDLLRLKEAGHSVYRTSHAGNWNIYKLLLSELGLPDCVWDVTCIHADKNNQPRHMLIGGTKLPLLNKDPGAPPQGIKYLTPYHRVSGNGGSTLSSFHLEPLRELYPGVITTQSEVLLEFEEMLAEVFQIIARYRPEWLSRYVFHCGCMTTSSKLGSEFRAKCPHGNTIAGKQADLAESAISTLRELKRLVLDPVDYEPLGGFLYSFELVVASFYLWSYWKFGDKAVYELSGPDMIGYATKPEFARKISEVLSLVGKYLPRLTPSQIEAKIVPTTFFRFGYPANCPVSRTVMIAHDTVRKIQDIKRSLKNEPELEEGMKQALKVTLQILQENSKAWDLFHDPARDAFYSQHDLKAAGTNMQILEGFMDIPFHIMGKLLRTLPQTEASLTRRLLSNPEPSMEDSFR